MEAVKAKPNRFSPQLFITGIDLNADGTWPFSFAPLIEPQDIVSVQLKRAEEKAGGEH